LYFLFMLRTTTISTLFPYTTLFRSYICVLSTRFLLLKNSRFLFVVKLALFKLFQDDPAREKHPDGSTCLSLLEKLFTTKRLRYFFRHKSLQVLIIYI